MYYGVCTKNNYERYWCSTTPNYDEDELWGICREEICRPQDSVTIRDATTTSLPMRGSDGTTEPWYTTPTKQTSTTPHTESLMPICYIPTYGGNADGAPCVFPFFYDGFIYVTCTKQSHSKLWCATTRYYDEDKLWGNCRGK